MIIKNDNVLGPTVKFIAKGRKALQLKQTYTNPSELARIIQNSCN